LLLALLAHLLASSCQAQAPLAPGAPSLPSNNPPLHPPSPPPHTSLTRCAPRFQFVESNVFGRAAADEGARRDARRWLVTEGWGLSRAEKLAAARRAASRARSRAGLSERGGDAASGRRRLFFAASRRADETPAFEKPPSVKSRRPLTRFPYPRRSASASPACRSARRRRTTVRREAREQPHCAAPPRMLARAIPPVFGGAPARC